MKCINCGTEIDVYVRCFSDIVGSLCPKCLEALKQDEKKIQDLLEEHNG